MSLLDLLLEATQEKEAEPEALLTTTKIASNMRLNRYLMSDGTTMEILVSYATPVAGFRAEWGWFTVDHSISNTTTRHISKYMGAENRKNERPVTLDWLYEQTIGTW